jgi:hypothetical protein
MYLPLLHELLLHQGWSLVDVKSSILTIPQDEVFPPYTHLGFSEVGSIYLIIACREDRYSDDRNLRKLKRAL